MAPFSLMLETGDTGQKTKILRFDAASLAEIEAHICNDLGLQQRQISWEYYDNEFCAWVSPDAFQHVPQKARVRTERGGNESGGDGAGAATEEGGADAESGPRNGGMDAAATVGGGGIEGDGATTGNIPLAASGGGGVSCIREGDDIPAEWRAVADRTREAYPGNNFILVRVVAWQYSAND